MAAKLRDKDKVIYASKRKLSKMLKFNNIADEDICKMTGVSMEDVMSKSRLRDVVITRDLLIINRWCNTNETTVLASARYNRHHSTLVHSRRKIENALLGYDSALLSLIDEIRAINYTPWRYVFNDEKDLSVNEVLSSINLSMNLGLKLQEI